jgi:hypothetical protein
MLTAIRMTVSLLKLRIGSAVAASALAGIVAANGPALAWWQAAGLDATHACATFRQRRLP